MNNLKKMGLLSVLLAAVSMTASAQQFSKTEDAIKYRKSALTIMGTNFGQLSAMAQGKAPYDAKLAAESGAIVEFAAKLPWTAFVEGSDKGETKAKPEIWTEQVKFKEAQDKLVNESQKLAVAAKSGKLEDLKVAVAATGGACKNCHDNFKNK
jgi:cytochrome c556